VRLLSDWKDVPLLYVRDLRSPFVCLDSTIQVLKSILQCIEIAHCTIKRGCLIGKQ